MCLDEKGDSRVGSIDGAINLSTRDVLLRRNNNAAAIPTKITIENDATNGINS